MDTPKEISQIILPQKSSHKGQNGRLLIIGGSHLFHAASLWSLEVASRIVDLVHYSSVPENNQIVQDLKEEFRDGIVVPRSDIDSYIDEDDCILIGPGMIRDKETEELANRLLKKYPHKKWIIDAGALQMMDISLIPNNAVLTPHAREFEYLKRRIKDDVLISKLKNLDLKQQVKRFALHYRCIVLVKGEVDIISDGEQVCEIHGGNSGMTKGGTGDVLAGLFAAIACKNDPFIAAVAGSFVNKQAGDHLFKKVGVYFNASDLADEIPLVMKQLFFP